MLTVCCALQLTYDFLFCVAGRFDIADAAVGLIATRDANSLIASKAAELQGWYRHQNRSECYFWLSYLSSRLIALCSLHAVQEKYVLENGADSAEMSAPVV